MPSSAVRVFTDPDEHAAAIRQGVSEMTVTGRGAFRSEIVRIDFHHLWMQRFSENMSRIRHTTGLGGRAVIAFPAQPGPAQSWQGVELTPANLIRHREGASYYHRSAGASVTAAMSLPLAEIAAISAAFGCDLSPPRDSSIVTPSAIGDGKAATSACRGRAYSEDPAGHHRPSGIRSRTRTSPDRGLGGLSRNG